MHTPSKNSVKMIVSRDNLETNPITIKPETENDMTEQFFLAPYAPTHHLGSRPNKVSALTAHVSPQIIHFQCQEPTLGLGNGPPSFSLRIK